MEAKKMRKIALMVALGWDIVRPLVVEHVKDSKSQIDDKILRALDVLFSYSYNQLKGEDDGKVQT